MSVALLSSVLVASLLGSVHCLAMCGPLVGLHGGARTMRLAMSHSLGRLATYVTFGALAGLVGSAVDLAGRVGNVQRAATLVAAAAIVGLGAYQIVHVYVTRARARGRAHEPGGAREPGRGCEPGDETGRGGDAPDLRGGARARSEVGRAGSSAFSSALVRIRPKSAARRAFAIGTLTGLLPCGWLWAFVIAAAGTGSVLAGALTMFAFWLGTVPAMVGLLRVTGPLLARVRARMPAITAVALIAVGLGTLALRWRDAGVTQVQTPHCHSHGAAS
jgi:sulfite exporter TauE/SafE